MGIEIPDLGELLSQAYVARWFGRDGLFTRDPAMLLQLVDDHRFEPFGVNRLQPIDVMLEWIVTRRRGLSLEEARMVCKREDPHLWVIVRLASEIYVKQGPRSVDPGMVLEFSYGRGLIRATTLTEISNGRPGATRGPLP